MMAVSIHVDLAVELSVIAVLQFCASISGVVAGIGSAMIFTVGWNLGGIAGWCSGSIIDIAVYQTIQALVVTPLQAFSLRRHCNFHFIGLACACWASAELVGTMLLAAAERSQSPWFKRGLGIMMMLIFFWETSNHWASAIASFRDGCSSTKHNSSSTNKSASLDTFSVWKRRNLIWTVAFGVGAGFLRGLFNVPILALIVFSLYSGMPKNEWLASQAALTFLVTLPKAYVLMFQLHAFSHHYWPQYIMATLTALAALPLGTKIGSHVDQKSFREFILALLFFGALLMSTHDTGVISVFAITILAGCFFLCVLAWKSKRVFSRRLPAPKRSGDGELGDLPSDVERPTPVLVVGNSFPLSPGVTPNQVLARVDPEVALSQTTTSTDEEFQRAAFAQHRGRSMADTENATSVQHRARPKTDV